MTARDLFRDGDWLDDYQIRGRLRAGGMATLFLAQRHSAAGVSRPVVIKVIHPHLAEDEMMVRMFVDEARISSHISHSNVVYVEKFGEHDGVYYIVMEYVDGCSLQQLLRACAAEHRLLPVAIAAHIATEAAAGLHAAHVTTGDDGAPLGIVHRDVSPSNVLLNRDGRIKLIDFGIAKAHGRLGATRSGSGLKGKLRYMSPDQAWGRPIDRRADIYALGICLWELLTCRRLFRGTNDLAVLELVRNPVIPPPSTLNPHVSPALDAIVLRATARRCDDRHQTALELRRDLMSVVPGAVAVPPELVGELVHRVCNPDRAPSISLDTATFEHEHDEPSPSPSPPPEASVSAAVGQTRSRGWPNRGLMLGGVAGACAIAVVVAITGRPRDREPRAVPPAPAALVHALDTGVAAHATAAQPAATPVPTPAPIELSIAPDDQADQPTAVATPAPTTPPPHRPAQPDPQRVTTVEADGAVLADEPTPRPNTAAAKPRPNPSSAVHVDDAVLAP